MLQRSSICQQHQQQSIQILRHWAHRTAVPASRCYVLLRESTGRGLLQSTVTCKVYKDCTSSIPRGRAVTHLKAQADDRQQEQQKEDSYNGASKEPGPNFDQGINWFCYTVLGLLFITDLTPAGALLRNSGSGLYWLATLQWGLFFIPTVVWAAQNRWRLRPLLLGPKPVPGPLVLLLAALLGVGIYFACTAAIAAKSGVSITDLGSTSLTGQTPPAPLPVPSVDGAVPGTSQQPQSLLQALGAGRPGDLDLTSWGRLWAVAALSPSVCEELLFRGFLLQALQRPRGAGRCLRSSGQASHSPSPSEPGSEEGPSLGRIDAIFVTGALFAAAHLDLSQFFSLSILGIACGAAATVTGSTIPAVVAHTAYNTAALVLGALTL